MAATGKTANRGFTLVEVLVALALMAVVLPIISQGLRLASLAGEVSQRKALAMRVAERALNQTILAGQWTQVGQVNKEQVGNVEMRWVIRNDPWSALNNMVSLNLSNSVNTAVVNPNTLHVLTADVSFPAQGQTYTVHLSTVIDITKQVNANTPPTQ